MKTDQTHDALERAKVEETVRETGIRSVGPGRDLAAQNPAQQVFLRGGTRDGVLRRIQDVANDGRVAVCSVPYARRCNGRSRYR